MNLKSLAISTIIGIGAFLPMSAEAEHKQYFCDRQGNGGEYCVEITFRDNGTAYVRGASYNEYTNDGSKGFMNCSTGYFVGDASDAQQYRLMKSFYKGVCRLAQDAIRNR